MPTWSGILPIFPNNNEHISNYVPYLQPLSKGIYQEDDIIVSGYTICDYREVPSGLAGCLSDDWANCMYNNMGNEVKKRALSAMHIQQIQDELSAPHEHGVQ